MGRHHGQTELLVRIAFGMILVSSLMTGGRAAQRLTAALAARGIDIGVLAYPLAFLSWGAWHSWSARSPWSSRRSAASSWEPNGS